MGVKCYPSGGEQICPHIHQNVVDVTKITIILYCSTKSMPIGWLEEYCSREGDSNLEGPATIGYLQMAVQVVGTWREEISLPVLKG